MMALDATGQGESIPRFWVIRAPGASMWYFVGICTGVAYDHDTLRGHCFIVN